MLLLLLLHAQVYSMPLVGGWVKGPSSPLHPLVAAACLRFAFSSLLADRAVNADTGAFLLLLCPEGELGRKGTSLHIFNTYTTKVAA